MRKIFFIIFLFIIIIVALYFWALNKIKSLRFSLQKIKVHKLTVKEISGILHLLIKGNLNGIEITNLDLNLYIDGYFVAKLEQKDNVIEQLPNGNMLARIYYHLSPKKVISMDHILMTLSNLGENNYTLQGTIGVRKWFIKLNIPVSFTDTFKNNEEV